MATKKDTHPAAECPYEAGCTGCRDAYVVYCEICGKWTVHLKRHEHPDPPLTAEAAAFHKILKSDNKENN